MGFGLTVLYIAFVFLRPQELFRAYATYQIMDVLAVLAILGTGLSLASGAPRPHLGSPEWWFGLAFIIWSSFSVAAAVRWFGGAYTTLLALSIPLFTFLLIMLNVTTRRRLVALVCIVWVCVLVLLAQAIGAYYSEAQESPFFIMAASRGSIDLLTDEGVTGPSDTTDDSSAPRTMVKRIRALGFLADPNDFAQALVCLIPLLWIVWRKRSTVRNVLMVLMPAALALWGVLLTRSRGGLVALASVVTAALIYRLRPRLRRPVGIAVLIMTVPGFVVLFGYARGEASASSRLEAWAVGLQMLKWTPIWGVGSGFFTDHHDRVAHSSFVQCFAETGLVGYYLWLACLVVSLMRVSSIASAAGESRWRLWARALQVSMIGFLVGALFLSRTTSPMLFFLVSLLAVFSAIAQREGQDVRLPGHWWATVLGIEVVSVLLVWATARAYY